MASLLFSVTSVVIWNLCIQPGASQTTNFLGFNAAVNRPISANITCGTPPESYFNTRQGYLPPRTRTISICNATDPTNSHPPQNMVDGSLATFWQTKNDEDRAYITINLGQVG